MNEENSEKSKIGVKESFQLIFSMWSYLKKWALMFYLCVGVGCTWPLAQTYFNSYVTKEITLVCTEGGDLTLKSALIRIIIICLVGIIVYPLAFGGLYNVYAKASGSIKKMVFEHTEKLSVSYVEEGYSGDLLTRISSDYNSAIQLFGYPVVGQWNPFSLVICIVVSEMIMLCTNLKLAIISIILSFSNLALINCLMKPFQQKEYIVKQKGAKAAQSIIDALSGVVVSRIFGTDIYLKKQYERNTEEIYKNSISLFRRKAVLNALIDIQNFFSFTAVLGIGLMLSTRKEISMANVVFIATMQLSISGVVTELSRRISDIQKYFVGAKRFLKFMLAPEEKEREELESVNLEERIAIRLENIKFGYQNVKVFQEFSLSVRNGERLAIVGGSGGGKSTLFKIFLEFFNIEEGKIFLFGKESKQYSLKTIRGLFSYVSQDCYLFDSTICENVRIAKPEASEKEIIEACYKANLKEFIESCPSGIYTQVGEHGSLLSGGQKQRIAIARAILKDAPILLLDEATSALDYESELQVKKALDKLVEKKTSIVIAHRLSTIKNMDRIVVIEQGKIVEEGSHESLLMLGRRYCELYHIQFNSQ